MRSKPVYNALSDIHRNIGLACGFVAGLTFDAFCADERTLYAVTRCLEITSEASRKLSTELKERHPDIPWTNIATAGNVYRHEYEELTSAIVWDTVQSHLVALRTAVEQEIARFTNE